MKAGALRHRLLIERPVSSQDALGQPTRAWETVAVVQGSLDPVSGRERYLTAQTMAETTHRARVRYAAGITPKMRIVFGGKYYQIVYVADDNRGRELVLDLLEGIVDG